MCTFKIPSQCLTDCCSISDGENENNAETGEKEGSPAGGTLRGHTSLTVGDEETGDTAMVTGGSRRFLGSSPTWLLMQMAMYQTHSRGKTHCKEFHKGGLKRCV